MQRKRGQQQHGVAIHDFAGMRDEQGAIGIAIESHAQIRAGLEHLGAQGFQMLGATMQIDVASVGGAADGFDLGPQAREQLRAEIRRRTVGGIDNNADARESGRQGGGEEVQIFAVEAGVDNQRFRRCGLAGFGR